jgi:hypothetical protein
VAISFVITWLINHLIYGKVLDAKKELLQSYKERIEQLSSGKEAAAPQEIERARQIGEALQGFTKDERIFLQYVAIRGKVFKSAFTDSGVAQQVVERCIENARKKGLLEEDHSYTSGETFVAMTTPVQHAILLSLSDSH